MSESVIDSEAVRLFFPDENYQPIKDWQVSIGTAVAWSCKQGTNLEIHIPDLQTGTDNTEPAVIFLDTRKSWRGNRILTEEEAAKIEFPYPPEPEWEDD